MPSKNKKSNRRQFSFPVNDEIDIEATFELLKAAGQDPKWGGGRPCKPNPELFGESPDAQITIKKVNVSSLPRGLYVTHLPSGELVCALLKRDPYTAVIGKSKVQIYGVNAEEVLILARLIRSYIVAANGQPIEYRVGQPKTYVSPNSDELGAFREALGTANLNNVLLTEKNELLERFLTHLATVMPEREREFYREYRRLAAEDPKFLKSIPFLRKKLDVLMGNREQE